MHLVRYLFQLGMLLPLLKAAQTPECARANTMSRAATISITLVLFIRKDNTGEECPLGS